MRAIKSWWFVLAFLSGLALAMTAEELILNWRESRLEFSAPRVHFLGGRPLQRLHDGAEVPFDFQVTLWTANRSRVFKRIVSRFVVSYDVWQEDFKVAKLETPARAASHLTAPAAEDWCFRQMSVDVAGLGGAEPFWARMEIRAQDGKDGLFGRGSIGDSGISLTGLIEIFSRPAASTQSHWSLEAGPFTLDELKRTHGRGS